MKLPHLSIWSHKNWLFGVFWYVLTVSEGNFKITGVDIGKFMIRMELWMLVCFVIAKRTYLVFIKIENSNDTIVLPVLYQNVQIHLGWDLVVVCSWNQIEAKTRIILMESLALAFGIEPPWPIETEKSQKYFFRFQLTSASSFLESLIPWEIYVFWLMFDFSCLLKPVFSRHSTIVYCVSTHNPHSNDVSSKKYAFSTFYWRSLETYTYMNYHVWLIE